MRVFMLLDKDHDGSLTLEEIVAGASRLGLTKDEARALFFKIDLDGSGDVSTEEFSRAFKREMPLDEKHVGQAPDWIKEMDSTTLFTFYKGCHPISSCAKRKVGSYPNYLRVTISMLSCLIPICLHLPLHFPLSESSRREPRSAAIQAVNHYLLLKLKTAVK